MHLQVIFTVKFISLQLLKLTKHFNVDNSSYALLFNILRVSVTVLKLLGILKQTLFAFVLLVHFFYRTRVCDFLALPNPDQLTREM